MRVCVDFEWRRVGELAVDGGGKLRFPDLPTTPGIYEFRLRGSSGSSVYIGETDNLRRRATHYRNPGPTQFTNIRLSDELRGHLEAGGSVEVSVVTAATLLAGDESTPLNLAAKAARRLLESAALVVAAASGTDEIENL